MTRAYLRRLWADRRGNVAIITAIVLPGLAVCTAAAVELGFVLGDKGKLQAAADAAALAGAHELVLAAEAGVADRAEAFALSQVQALTERGAVEATAEIIDDGAALRVHLKGTRPSFFGSLLPPGGFKTNAVAVAASMGRMPLCILIHGRAMPVRESMEIKGGQISATGCLLHSNKDIYVDKGKIVAGAVRAVTGATGAILPSPEIGAEEIADPFTAKDLTTKLPCKTTKDVKFEDASGAAVRTLPPGHYCHKVEVKKFTRLKLTSGDYFFDEDFVIDDDATLTGTDVVLIFDESSKFEFKSRSRVSLEGRKGAGAAFAGFLIITKRSASTSSPKEFTIWSDHVTNLLGVIYIPDSKLVVKGKTNVAQDSDWTVIVARALQLDENPTLNINKDYAASDVPVPKGVGPSGSAVWLDK